MAPTIAKLVKYAGGRDVWGGHGVYFCNYTGPASYLGGAAYGDAVDSIGGLAGSSGGNTPLRNIDNIITGLTVSGNFRVEAQPIAAGPVRRWVLRWFNPTTSAEIADATNLSAEVTLLTIIGG